MRSCGPDATSPLNCSVSDCQSQCGSNTICTGVLTQPELFSTCTCQAGFTSTNGHDCTTANPSASTSTSDVDKYVAAIVTIAVVLLVVILIFAIITFQRTKGKVAASLELTVRRASAIRSSSTRHSPYTYRMWSVTTRRCMSLSILTARLSIQTSEGLCFFSLRCTFIIIIIISPTLHNMNDRIPRRSV